MAGRISRCDVALAVAANLNPAGAAIGKLVPRHHGPIAFAFALQPTRGAADVGRGHVQRRAETALSQRRKRMAMEVREAVIEGQGHRAAEQLIVAGGSGAHKLSHADRGVALALQMIQVRRKQGG